MTTWYAIVNHVTGELVSTGTVVADDATIANQGFDKIELGGDPTGQVWDPVNRVFTAAPAPAAAPLTPIQFAQRFTPQEFGALQASADPVVKFFLYQVQIATSIHLGDASVQQGFAYLVSVGLLTQARANVLSQP